MRSILTLSVLRTRAIDWLIPVAYHDRMALMTKSHRIVEFRMTPCIISREDDDVKVVLDPMAEAEVVLGCADCDAGVTECLEHPVCAGNEN